MKKTKQRNSNYSISKTEYLFLKKIEEERLIIFTPKEIMHILTWKSSKIHNILQQLKNKKIITNIKRNTYTITETINEYLFQIAVESISPSYISFWSALSYYGFTTQQPNTIQVVTPKQYKTIDVNNHKIIPTKFKKERFFGYQKISHFTIAEKEKAIIDSLAYPEKAGGFKEVIKCLKNSWNELDKKTFIDYLFKFKSTTLNSRVGYILEELNLKSIKTQLPSTYIKLNTEKSIHKKNVENFLYKNKRNKKWHIIINDNLKTE